MVGGWPYCWRPGMNFVRQKKKRQKILNYFAKSPLYAARHRFHGRGATLEGPSKTTLATCSALPFKNLGKLMSFHWHPHNKGIYKAAWMFAGKLYSSVVPNQPVAAVFISLVTGLQREAKTPPAASFTGMFLQQWNCHKLILNQGFVNNCPTVEM